MAGFYLENFGIEKENFKDYEWVFGFDLWLGWRGCFALVSGVLGFGLLG